MRRLLSFVMALLLALCLTGCGSENIVNIPLKGLLLSGYEWTYTTSAEGVVRERSCDYRSGDSLCSVGRPGVFVYKFEPVAEGETRLDFVYRNDTTETDVLYSAAFLLRVDAEGTITYEILQEPTYGTDFDF